MSIATSKEQYVVGKSAAKQIIGEKLMQHTAAGPYALTTTIPGLVESHMKSIQQIWAKQVPKLRPNILVIQRPGFGGAKKETMSDHRTETKRSRKCPRTSVLSTVSG